YLQLEPGRADQSSYFHRVNAGKESLAVDMVRTEGRAVLHDLARHAYSFVEAVAQTGPWRARPAFAHIINAQSGLMHLEQGDEAAPRASNLQAADVLAGPHAAGAIMGALIRRGRTGRGAHLDVSMPEALVAADSVTYAAVLNGGQEHGNPRPGMVVAAIGDRS